MLHATACPSRGRRQRNGCDAPSNCCPGRFSSSTMARSLRCPSRELPGGRRPGSQSLSPVAGREGAAKRIDVLATAIWNEMGVDEILALDLSYAPPFAPVWDPVVIAARKALDAVEADNQV